MTADSGAPRQSAPTQPELTVSVVSWNTAGLLRRCLTSVFNHRTRHRVEVHVVDNASEDGSAEMVRREFPAARLTVNRENVGFARAHNQVWRQAAGRYWLLLNSDAELRAGAVDALVRFMDSRPRAGLASARILHPDGTPQHCVPTAPTVTKKLLQLSGLHHLFPPRLRARVMRGPHWGYDESVRAPWVWGTALVARREAVAEVGPLAEEFFMYGEDIEWCLRMKKRGWEVWFCHEAEVTHLGAQSAALRWSGDEKRELSVSNYYRALEMHHSRAYVQTLRAIRAVGLGGQWLARRLSERSRPEGRF
jgi:GT2 family glycosyltransferase